MTDAREIIASKLPFADAIKQQWAQEILDALTTAGYRILGPDEVDQVTVGKAADRARECFDDPQAEADPDYVPAAIRALGRKA